MTRDEFRLCLATIHWTLPQLAEILECDLSYVEALDRGDIEAPPNWPAVSAYLSMPCVSVWVSLMTPDNTRWRSKQ